MKCKIVSRVFFWSKRRRKNDIDQRHIDRGTLINVN